MTPPSSKSPFSSSSSSSPSTRRAPLFKGHPTARGAGRQPVDAPGRRRLPVLLRRAWYGLNQAFRRRIAHTSVTPDQFTVMRTLIERDPKGITQRELTGAMASDANTVASLLERMESNGYIRRKPHEKDRRAHRIQLLAIGRSKYEEVREVAVALQNDVLACLHPDRRETFLEDLHCVAESCQDALEKSPKKGRK